MQRILSSLIVVTALISTIANARAADFVSSALAGLPSGTLRVEYSNAAKLRKLSNYDTLHQRFLGPRLLQLESALAQIGIKEDNIDELMIGWKPGDKEMDLYGYASGHFSKADVDRQAAARSFTPTPIAGEQAYCLQAGVTGTCVVVLENSLGAFGPLATLTSLLETNAGQSPSLGSDERIAPLVSDIRKDSPIWGIALGAAIGDWFSGWMSGQTVVKLDWSRVFEKVDSLTYTIDAADKASLDMKLNCTTAEDAATLRQLLDGLKMAQQLAWQSQNPGRDNPYESMTVAASDKQVGLQLTMAYTQLQLASGIGATNK